jgi:hypothetical protein
MVCLVDKVGVRVGYGLPEKIPGLPHFPRLSTGKCEQALTELSTGLSTGLSTEGVDLGRVNT